MNYEVLTITDVEGEKHPIVTLLEENDTVKH